MRTTTPYTETDRTNLRDLTAQHQNAFGKVDWAAVRADPRWQTLVAGHSKGSVMQLYYSLTGKKKAKKPQRAKAARAPKVDSIETNPLPLARAARNGFAVNICPNCGCNIAAVSAAVTLPSHV